MVFVTTWFGLVPSPVKSASSKLDSIVSKTRLTHIITNGISPKMMGLCCFAVWGCGSNTDKSSVDVDDTSSIAEQSFNTVIFPLLSVQGNMSSLNFFDRETQTVSHIIESQTTQKFIDAHQVGDQIYALKEDIHGNSPTIFHVLQWDGQVEKEIEIPTAHHTIAPFAGKIAYLGTEQIQENGQLSIIDRVFWLEPTSEEQGLVLDLKTVVDVSLLSLSFSQQGDMWDVTHANTIRWDSSRKLFVLTFAGINAIWTFDVDGQISARSD